MTERPEWMDGELLALWTVVVAILGGGALLLGSSIGSVAAGIGAGTIALYAHQWWTREDSAEESGGDRNRRDITIDRN